MYWQLHNGELFEKLFVQTQTTFCQNTTVFYPLMLTFLITSLAYHHAARESQIVSILSILSYYMLSETEK